MNGLEIARKYYETYGKPMLEEEFPELLPHLAIGFVGSGSERFGFDDIVSRDHDFEPGFCIFLPGEEVIDRRNAFLLERAYGKLPKEFEGVKRQWAAPVGGHRNGVIRTADFYREKVGKEDGNLSLSEWLTIPDEALSEAVNGEVFSDPYGEFSEIRARLTAMPEDIRLKRLAGHLLLMGQSGQYNFPRTLLHGEPEAASLSCHEFVLSAMKVFFLLEGRYLPYYKWSFRALRALPGGTEIADDLSYLLSSDHRNPDVAKQKAEIIEKMAATVICRVKSIKRLSEAEARENRGFCVSGGTNDLEPLAYAVNDVIADPEVRGWNILAGV